MKRFGLAVALVCALLALTPDGRTLAQQAGGAFVPSFNYAISGFWNWTNRLPSTLPAPFEVGGVRATGIVSRTTDLTNAQVLALATTPVIVVPAPGAGLYVDVIAVQLAFDYTTAYTGNGNLRLYYTNATDGPAASAYITASGFIVSVSSDRTVRVTGTPDNTPSLPANAAVILHAGTVYTGGNAANTLRVVVHYRLVQVAGAVI